ncbi:MAG TPA: four-carbon acid sugar kinase family protein [Prolixibacteraceae bacterium]|nr:four-carbon acid sugar kinase family protein [Prolixibacteraceae bacterium]
MIAVIADDFTGAAEIGGVGLRYGLNVLIETVVNKAEGVDLLVIATDTRSLCAEEASQVVKRITGELLELEPVFIFKKIDSVLRGHVAMELEALMCVADKSKALIVAANPSMGRTIVKGKYFVDSLPLNETSFADDPEFPVHSADVADIVKPSEYPVFSVGLNDSMPDRGIMIADVASIGELSRWATKTNQEMAVAGGSDFFDALLGTMHTPRVAASHTDLSFGESSLFIFGSMYPKPVNMLEKFYSNNVVKMNMPEGIYYHANRYSGLLNEWSSQIADRLKNGYSVIVTIEHQPENETSLSLHIRESIGRLVSMVENQFDLNDLFIEGGATTSVVLKYLNINKLYPYNEADFGVIQMKAEGYPNMCITTKPGSYVWPEHLTFESSNPAIS